MKRLAFSDIESMVESRNRENVRLDYKRDLPGRTDKEKKEFCEDVVALANTRGGLIIYGVAEGSDGGRESGVPESIVGVAMNDPDAEILRLGSILRSGLSPRVSGIDIYWAEEEGDDSQRRRCLIVSTPLSLSRPHMVTSGGAASRFWARSGAGKYFMDVGEIRNAFEASAGWLERLRLWRADRTSSVSVGRGVVQTPAAPAVVLHIVPLSAFQTSEVLPLTEQVQVLNSQIRPPFFSSGSSNWRWNLDGYLVTSGAPELPSGLRGYTQVFRSGIVEGVDFASLRRESTIPATAIEEGVVGYVRSTLEVLSGLGLRGAVAVLLTLVNVRGFRLALPGQSVSDYECDRDFLSLPESIVEEDNPDLEGLLRPAFDSLWQAFGSTGSPRYRNA